MITNVEFWGANEIVNGGMQISWSYNDTGFGQLNIIQERDGTISIDSEFMGKEFVKKVVLELIDATTMID